MTPITSAVLLAAMAGGADVLDLVRQLAQLRPFTREGVARLTGKALELDRAASNDYFAFYQWHGSRKEPLAEVDLRLPKPSSSAKDGLVALTLGDRPCIDQARVKARFGPQPEFSVPQPEVPYEFSLSYPQTWGQIHFAFARRSRCLMEVTLDATEPPRTR